MKTTCLFSSWLLTLSQAQVETLNNTNIKTGISLFCGSEAERNESVYLYGSIEQWSTSLVTDMSNLGLCSSLNANIGGWDVSSVTRMSSMLHNANSFNQNIDNWDVSKVATMYRMFYNARQFNQPLNSWNVKSVIRAWRKCLRPPGNSISL